MQRRKKDKSGGNTVENQVNQKFITHRRRPKKWVKYINSWENIYFIVYLKRAVIIVPLKARTDWLACWALPLIK